MKKNTMSKTFTSFVFLVVVILSASLLFSFLRSGQHMFYMQYGSKIMYGEIDNFPMYRNSYNMFYCKTALGYKPNYTIKIVPNNIEYDFNYTENGAPRGYKGVNNLTSGFTIIQNDSYIAIFIENDFSMSKLLSKVYDNAEIVITDSNVWVSTKCYFTMIVSAENEEIRVHFYIKGVQT